MKNALIIILVIGVLILGFLFFKEKNQDDNRNPWPETEPATQTNNQTSQNNNQTNSNPCSPSIVVSAPATGAAYTVGQQVTIKWTTCGVQKVLIDLVSGGKDFGYITQNPISASTGSYQWTATNPGKGFTDQDTNSYQIAIESEDGSVMAKSGTFTVTTPSQTSNNVKTYSDNGFKIDYPKDVVVQEENAEGGPYRVINFGGDLVVRYTNNAAWFEQYDLADLELVGSKTVNGNTFKIYQGAGQGNTLWLKIGTTGYALNFGDGTRIDLDTFNLI